MLTLNKSRHYDTDCVCVYICVYVCACVCDFQSALSEKEAASCQGTHTTALLANIPLSTYITKCDLQPLNTVMMWFNKTGSL